MIGSVQQARRLLTAIAIFFFVIDVAAAAVLFSPLGHGNRDAEYEALRVERQQKDAETRPTRNMDKKLVESRESIAAFYKNRLPASYSEISESLGKAASEHHVVLSQIRYEPKPTGIGGLTNVAITVSVSGDYAAEMNFINSLEREKRFYVLDRVMIGDTGNNPNLLRVDVQLETFLRTAATT